MKPPTGATWGRLGTRLRKLAPDKYERVRELVAKVIAAEEHLVHVRENGSLLERLICEPSGSSEDRVAAKFLSSSKKAVRA